MESILQQLLAFLQGSSFLKILAGTTGVLAYSTVFLWMFRRFPVFNKVIKNLIRSFTYSESYTKYDNNLNERLLEMEIVLEKIKKDFEKNILKDNEQIIRNSLDIFLEQNLNTIIKEKIDLLKQSEDILLNEIKTITTSIVDKYLKSININEISSIILHHRSDERKCVDEKLLDEISMEQLRNSGRIKTVMINLFVFFNLGILFFYIFGNTSKLTHETIYGIIGVYVSLAAFIIYIYRVANARTAVVMAIREDSKKYYDVVNYLTRFKPNSEITEHDVDLIRMIIVNRSEREKGTEHPYEMIFKSIADSNIQFKGGKMSVSKEKQKKEA